MEKQEEIEFDLWVFPNSKYLTGNKQRVLVTAKYGDLRSTCLNTYEYVINTPNALVEMFKTARQGIERLGVSNG